MPEVPMIATKDFGYNTRRLRAGDEFPARNSMDARILERVRRVAEPAKPEARVKEVVAPRILTTEEVLETEVVEKPKKPTLTIKKAPKAGARKAKAKK